MNSKRKLPAKSLHTWNRRDFSVGSAGYFTVLKPAGWFAASRLPGGFRYLGGQPTEIASSQAHENPVGNRAAASQEPAMLWRTMELSAQDQGFMRPALVILGATAITSILLWWIAFPRFH